MSDQIEPTQADRDAAAALGREMPSRPTESGFFMSHIAPLAFAAHRQSEYARGLEDAAQIAEAIDSGRGNEREIAKAIRNLKDQPR